MNRLNLIKIAFFSAIAISVSTACGKKGASSDPAPNGTSSTAPDTAKYNTWPSTADIYFVGTSRNSAISITDLPTLWKNGVATSLVSGNVTSAFEPTGIAIKNNDVYITGNASIAPYGKAFYLKNGVLTLFASDSKAAAIAISSNNDVYIAGAVSGQPTVWKNGVPATLPTSPYISLSEATSIYINGADVYVTGIIYNQGSSPRAAALWKNGQLVSLDGTTAPNESVALGVSVNGTDVYVAGTIYQKGAVIWKNGISTTLSLPTSLSSAVTEATTVALNGADVYAAGYANGKVTVWKNGTAQTLPYNTSPAQYKVSLGFYNSDVYVGAAGYDNANPYNYIFWKNNVGYQLGKFSNTVSGIAIVTH